MKNAVALFIASVCLFLSSCHRPVAYFQRTSHVAAQRLVTQPDTQPVRPLADSLVVENQPVGLDSVAPVMASLRVEPIDQTTNARLNRRTRQMQSLLEASTNKTIHQQPKPKPQKKLKLGNQIRQSLGMRLRPELNWWQRINWKLKASVLVILVAVIFAILHITILAIIFGIVGAFLLITGLKKSFKVKRPWF